MELIKKWVLPVICSLCILGFGVNALAADERKAPVIEEIKVLTPSVTAGEKLKLQVGVSDDTKKISTIRATFFSPKKKDTIFIEMNFKEDGPLSSTYTLESETIPTTHEAGKWTAGMIQIRDVTGAFTNYTTGKPGNIDYAKLTFKLTDPKQSTEIPEKNDNFKALKSLKDIHVDHAFTYTFDVDVTNSTFTKKNIYVKDSKGTNVPLLFVKEYDAKTKKSTVTVVPVDNYAKNSTYTLYIKDIIGKNGKTLKQYTKVTFTTIK